jgi:hypothetical protein
MRPPTERRVQIARLVALVIAACDSAPPPVAEQPPTTLPPPAIAQPAIAPPTTHVAAPRRDPTIASWSSEPRHTPGSSSPSCITGPTRFIQYADLDAHGSPRFCVWSSPELSTATVGCWRVELATGTYVAETGVWFSAPQPERADPRGPVRLGTLTIDPDGRVVVVDPPRTIRPPACAR